MRHVLLAAALASATLPAQEVYERYYVEAKAYSTDEDEWDFADGYARQPYLHFSCTSVSGRDASSTGGPSFGQPESRRLAVTVPNWDALDIANWSSGEGWFVIGVDGSERIAVRRRYYNAVHFVPAELPKLLKAVRDATSPVSVRIIDKASDAYITMPPLSFRTEELDVCRLAYACGDQTAIQGACGTAVQPPAPSLEMLKQDIQDVLDRYPTN